MDRDRKVLFNEVATDYDRYRPSYPSQAFDEIEELSSLAPEARLLEIGCGTGQATTSLARRGYSIDAVELGSALAMLARENLRDWPKVHVHNVAFELFSLDATEYDLVYSAQAFHWIDPEIRLEKTAQALALGGSFCLLNNFTRPQEGAITELRERLQETMGTGGPFSSPEQQIDRWSKELKGSVLFDDLEVRQHPWMKRYSANDYVGLYRTYSDFRSLPNDRREQAEGIIREVVESYGGEIEREYVCVLFHARSVGR